MLPVVKRSLSNVFVCGLSFKNAWWQESLPFKFVSSCFVDCISACAFAFQLLSCDSRRFPGRVCFPIMASGPPHGELPVALGPLASGASPDLGASPNLEPLANASQEVVNDARLREVEAQVQGILRGQSALA